MLGVSPLDREHAWGEQVVRALLVQEAARHLHHLRHLLAISVALHGHDGVEDLRRLVQYTPHHTGEQTFHRANLKG